MPSLTERPDPPGLQLVVRGKVMGNGLFRAAEIRTKCPSKYKSQYEARK